MSCVRQFICFCFFGPNDSCKIGESVENLKECSKFSRLMYTLFTLSVSLLCIFMRHDYLKDILTNYFINNSTNSFCNEKLSFCHLTDTDSVSNFLIFRLSWGTAAFFLLHALLTLRVDRSLSMRGSYHNGYWIVKLVLLCLSCTLFVCYIPNNQQITLTFLSYINLTASSLATILHYMIIINMAYNFSIFLAEAYERTEARKYCYALFFSTCFLYYISSIINVVLFLLTGKLSQCWQIKSCELITATLWIIASIVSVLKKVQLAQPRSGLLQSSLIAFLLTVHYGINIISQLSWENEPDKCHIAYTNNFVKTLHLEEMGRILMIAINIGALLSLSFMTCAHSWAGSCVFKKCFYQDNSEDGNDEVQEQHSLFSSSPNRDNVTYSYSTFLIIQAVSIIQIGVILNEWSIFSTKTVYHPTLHTLRRNLTLVSQPSVAFWFKTVSIWMSGGIYIVSLLWPALTYSVEAHVMYGRGIFMV